MQKGHQTQLNLYCHSIHRVLKEGYGDELFWKEKFYAANGKAQAYIQGALLFSILSFGLGGRVGGGVKDFFSFVPGSQFVPTMFLKFPMGSQFVPQHVLHSTSLLTHML
jgi:hypothetical protein